jgi:anti-sigma factor RsiW
MSCEKMQELMPDVAMGAETPSLEMKSHLEACGKCAETLESMRATMALLDEWNVPEPSPYFDTKMQALLREEKEKAPTGVFASGLAWFRRPVFGIASVAVLAFGVAFVNGDRFPTLRSQTNQQSSVQRGTAVADLEALDKNSDMLQDFDSLDSSPDDDNSSKTN